MFRIFSLFPICGTVMKRPGTHLKVSGLEFDSLLWGMSMCGGFFCPDSVSRICFIQSDKRDADHWTSVFPPRLDLVESAARNLTRIRKFFANIDMCVCVCVICTESSSWASAETHTHVRLIGFLRLIQAYRSLPLTLCPSKRIWIWRTDRRGSGDTNMFRCLQFQIHNRALDAEPSAAVSSRVSSDIWASSCCKPSLPSVTVSNCLFSHGLFPTWDRDDYEGEKCRACMLKYTLGSVIWFCKDRSREFAHGTQMCLVHLSQFYDVDISEWINNNFSV